MLDMTFLEFADRHPDIGLAFAILGAITVLLSVLLIVDGIVHQPRKPTTKDLRP